MLYEFHVWKLLKREFRPPKNTNRRPHEPASEIPTTALKLLGMLAKCQKALLLRFVTRWDERDVQGNRTRIFQIWHIPTAAIGSCIIFVRLQNTASQEASQGAKSKQGIVAQSLSGWQSTVFCILYEYMQIYVWDVNKVHLSTIAEAWVGFTCHYD